MKNKYWLGAGAAAVTLIIVAAGVFFWNSSRNGDKVSFGAASENVSAAQPSNSSGDYASQTASLGVNSNNTGQNLGQISPTSKQSNSGLGGTTPSSSSGGGASGGSSQTIDPSTFAQYDKYKSATQALFGDVSAGSGAALSAGQTATVVYKGWLTNGQLFDESKAGSDGKLQAFQFKVGSGQVIVGWDQGLTGMKVGGTRLVIVPPAAGYGATDHAPIPANSVLVFLVQLIDAK